MLGLQAAGTSGIRICVSHTTAHHVWSLLYCFPLLINLLWQFFADLHESWSYPLQRPHDKSRHLQHGGYHYSYANWHPALGEQIPSLCVSILPLHRKCSQKSHSSASVEGFPVLLLGKLQSYKDYQNICQRDDIIRFASGEGGKKRVLII